MLNKPLPVTQEIDKCIKDYYVEVKRQQDRNYYHANKERILKNKAARLKADYEKDPDKFKNKQLKYYNTHKERILKERKEKRENMDKIRCECGSVFHAYFKTQHKRTYKHCRYVDKQK